MIFQFVLQIKFLFVVQSSHTASSKCTLTLNIGQKARELRFSIQPHRVPGVKFFVANTLQKESHYKRNSLPAWSCDSSYTRGGLNRDQCHRAQISRGVLLSHVLNAVSRSRPLFCAAPIGSIRASLLWYRGRRPVGLRRDTRNRRVRRCGPSRGFQCVILRDPAPIGSAPASVVSRETTSGAPAGHGIARTYRIPA